MIKEKIKVGIIGVGNCCKALIEGVSKLQDVKDNDIPGIMISNIGGYFPGDIEFVAAWDIDKRKVYKPLDKAIKAKPNCAMELKEDVSNVTTGTLVRKGPVLDGFPIHMLDYPDDKAFRVDNTMREDTKEDIIHELKTKGVEILLNYLPVGSAETTKFYMEAAIEAKVAVVNCIPEFIASNPEWEQKFIDAGIPIIGDDVRSQIGASIISAKLQEMLFQRGHEVTLHLQNNIGGNCDFLNMQDQSRLSSKKISKENVIKKQNELAGKDIIKDTIHAGPAQYFPALGDNKRAQFVIKAEGFCGTPLEFTADLNCWDSSNSAGIAIDAIRLLKVAKEMGIVGALHGASAATKKSPPIDMSTNTAMQECKALANRELTDFTKVQLAKNNPDAKKLVSYFEDLAKKLR